METQPIKPVKEKATAKKNVLLPAIIIILVILLGAAGFVGYQRYKAAKLEAAKLEDAYQEAVNVMESGDYGAAVGLFAELGDYKDSPDMIQECYDAQSLENLQSIYRSMDTMYQMDNKLASVVSTVIDNVDKINSAGTKLKISANTAISCLYDGDPCRAYARCSLYDLASIKAYFPSVQVSEGTVAYEAYIPILSTETAQTFVDSIEAANTLMKDFGETINAENVSAKYQELQEQLLLTCEALKDYHSFIANKPSDYENFSTTARQKQTAVSELLNNLPSTIKAGK